MCVLFSLASNSRRHSPNPINVWSDWSCCLYKYIRLHVDMLVFFNHLENAKWRKLSTPSLYGISQTRGSSFMLLYLVKLYFTIFHFPCEICLFLVFFSVSKAVQVTSYDCICLTNRVDLEFLHVILCAEVFLMFH